MAAHHLAGLLPHREQHALAFVVAGAVGVRLAEVPEGDRAVDRGEDLGDADLLGGAREDVPATHAALRADQAGALQCEQDLLQVGLRQARALGDVADRRGASLVDSERERQQGAAGVVASGRHSHDTERRGWSGDARERPARGGFGSRLAVHRPP
jgi:hypothetical protein